MVWVRPHGGLGAAPRRSSRPPAQPSARTSLSGLHTWQPLGVNRVGLAAAGVGGRSAGDIHHDLACGGKGKRGAVAAGALHAPDVDRPSLRAQASRFGSRGSVEMEVSYGGQLRPRGEWTQGGVNPDGPGAQQGCMLVMAVSSPWQGGEGTRAAGRTAMRGVWRQARIRSVRPVGVTAWPRPSDTSLTGTRPVEQGQDPHRDHR